MNSNEVNPDCGPRVFALVMVFALIATHLPAQEPGTSFRPELYYTQSAFDSDTCCWRKLSAEKKYTEAANLIVTYLQSGKPDNKHSLHWHAGQLFALAQQNPKAIRHMKKTYSLAYIIFGDADAKAWYYYATGSIAFLGNNKPKLDRIIAKWEKKLPEERNLEVLRQLSNNWGQSYEQALHCN